MHHPIDALPGGGVVARALALILVCLCAFAIVDDSAAQEPPPFSVSYTAKPEALITVDADGNVLTKLRPSAGLATATIEATGYTLTNGEYVPTGSRTEQYLTLNFITECSVHGGCPELGIRRGAAFSPGDREQFLREMSLATMSMFAASGANVNEVPGGHRPLLWIVLDSGEADAVARAQILIDAGADIDATTRRNGQNVPMLFAAAAIQSPNGTRLVRNLIAAGVDVNATANFGVVVSALDYLATNGFSASEDVKNSARLILEAGGRCLRFNAPQLCNL